MSHGRVRDDRGVLQRNNAVHQRTGRRGRSEEVDVLRTFVGRIDCDDISGLDEIEIRCGLCEDESKRAHVRVAERFGVGHVAVEQNGKGREGDVSRVPEIGVGCDWFGRICVESARFEQRYRSQDVVIARSSV